jgi:starch phosphorylase
MSIIEEHPVRAVRMANLASVGSFAINGVAELQSKLLAERTLNDFYRLWPGKFGNKTNGVTPRRFLRLANPRLSELITSRIGDGWLTDLESLRELEPLIEQAQFRSAWRQVKHANKQDLAGYILERTGIQVRVDSIFDVLVKRLHEYKRQLLKVLHVITLYQRIKADPGIEIVPRTVIFGAKAAPGYNMAKRIIKLINSVAAVVNQDPDVRDGLKVVFVPNFNVSVAEKIYPAAEISEQISMAGKEASGTGNMKFALNGAVTTGTLDGANVEIRERVGAENFYLFGLTAEQVFALKEQGYTPMDVYASNPELKLAIDSLTSGLWAADRELFKPIAGSLLYRDEYLLLADYASYVECQEAAAQAYQDVERWTRMSILNSARCGFFSSDRTISQYCNETWDIRPVHVPL